MQFHDFFNEKLLVGRQRILEAYRHAVESRYRFFSYGDACFLERDPEAAHSID